GDTQFTKLLLGLGLNEFSMHPNALAEVKNVIINTDIEKLKPIIEELLQCTSDDQFQVILDKLNQS
ncbi:MAG: phosphoenolpyruvate--protein phosphotransferase, partial [Thioalkalispiraceae bacterium]